MSSNKLDWSGLPPEIQHAVAQHVQHAASLASMRAACTSMRAAVNHDDIWQTACEQHAWTQHHAPAQATTVHAVFAAAITQERAHCLKLSNKIHATRRNLSMLSAPGAGSHGGIAIHGSRPVSGHIATLSVLEASRERIVDAFAADGLRAKPYSARQRAMRAISAWCRS